MNNQDTIDMPKYNRKLSSKNISYQATKPIIKNKDKLKRIRSAFTTGQISYLEKEFAQNPYVSLAQRENMAKVLSLPERAIKIWFQNRRMKEKRDTSKPEQEKHVNVETNAIPEKLYNMLTLPLMSQKLAKSQEDVNQKEINPPPKISLRNDVFTYEPNFTVEEQKPNGFSKNNDDIPNISIHIQKPISSNCHKITSELHLNGSLISTMHDRDSYSLTDNNFKSYHDINYEKIRPINEVKIAPAKYSPVSQPSHAASDSSRYQEMHQQHPILLPLDLSSYYSSIRQHNRIDGCDVLPHHIVPDLPYYRYVDQNSRAPCNKCSCDCHSPLNSPVRLQMPSPYSLLYTHYVPHAFSQQNKN